VECGDLAGIPSSSSHALIGGLVGAACKGGWKAVLWSGLGKTAAAIVLSPLTGFLALLLICSWPGPS
jgi:PiT family inorganic phosphate transporter